MSSLIKRSYQHPEVSSSHAGVRMKFWGVCCVGGKAYKQVVNYRFHLTMAVLEPKTVDVEARDRIVTLSVIHHGQVFLLCVLKHGEIHQVNLNLIFDKGDDVTFTVGGFGTVNLTGYQLIDSQNSNFDTDNKHYCPVAEMRSPIRNRLNHDHLLEDSKFKKALKGKVRNREEEEEDDDDSDFSINAIVGEEESSSEEYEELDDEMSESEIKALKQELEETELIPELTASDDKFTPLKSERSEKRKLEKISFSEKRMKRETDEERDDESDSDKEDLNSSIGNTPMPKREDDSVKAKKKQKKKKRLSEISNINKSIKENADSPNTSKKPKNKFENQKHPVLKLDGGVECQDVTIGKGPVATNGKIVSIFYIGRLENKSIFDSRTAPQKPFSFKLGVPEVIKGLDIGISGMKVGGQRKLKIPAKMGYGSKNISNVPANSTLFFNVELMSVN